MWLKITTKIILRNTCVNHYLSIKGTNKSNDFLGGWKHQFISFSPYFITSELYRNLNGIVIPDLPIKIAMCDNDSEN